LYLLGEALGLKWGDVDDEQETITIRRALQFQAGKNMVEVSTKTEGSRATLHVGQDVIAALRDHRTRRRFEGASCVPTAYIFTSEVGTPPVPCAVLRALHRALTKLGLPLIRVHDLRHGVATLLTQAGVPVIAIQAYMRHSSASQTMHYSHLTAGMNELPASALHQLLDEARKVVSA
jgi:integrase